ncbi:MAG: hypothetical protein DMG96_26740, partial [Acidobacteria bacterium]
MKRLIFLVMSLVFATTFRANAQDLANLVGTIADPSGAVLGGVEITVSNADRGFTRTVQSDEGGSFSVMRVPVGTYTITAEKQGFQKLVNT